MENDSWLEAGLKEALDPIVGEPARPGMARYALLAPGSAWRSRTAMAGGIAASLTLASALAAAAATGSANPAAWGQRVSEAVETCKADLGSGQHGIGSCISVIARGKDGDTAAHGDGDGHGRGHHSDATPEATGSAEPSNNGLHLGRDGSPNPGHHNGSGGSPADHGTGINHGSSSGHGSPGGHDSPSPEPAPSNPSKNKP